MIIKFLSAILKLHFHLWHFIKSVASANHLPIFVSLAEKLFKNNRYPHFRWYFRQLIITAETFKSDKLTNTEFQKDSPGLYKASGKILPFPGSNRFSFSKLSFPAAKSVLGEISANKMQINRCWHDADSIATKNKSGTKKTRNINTIILHYPNRTTYKNQKSATRPDRIPVVNHESFTFNNSSISLIYKMIKNQPAYLKKLLEYALATMRIFFVIIVPPKFTESG
jgi:hypothetical protein